MGPSGGVGNRQARQLSEALNRTFPLSDALKQFKPMSMAEVRARPARCSYIRDFGPAFDLGQPANNNQAIN
jgi:hypothetical protein